MSPNEIAIAIGKIRRFAEAQLSDFNMTARMSPFSDADYMTEVVLTFSRWDPKLKKDYDDFKKVAEAAQEFARQGLSP